jgi:uncharacterized protein YbcV (DUF1398 family)
VIRDALQTHAHFATIFSLAGLLLSELRNGDVYSSKRAAKFSIEEIRAARERVRSGVDFPTLVRDLIALGVEKYDTYVGDGHSEYFGQHGHEVVAEATRLPIEISDVRDDMRFQAHLNLHRQGDTDYSAFCRDAASDGVHKWTVNMRTLTCSYYDSTGKEMLVEQITVV